MRYCLLVVLLGIAASASAQCNHTNYGNGFTCVQTANPTAANATVPANQTVLTLPANTTPGDGIIVFGNYCTTNPCTATAPIANVFMSDGANDTGWQPCSFNSASANGIRFWYCWWLPSVGTTTTFTIHANGAYGLGIWVAEFSGGCNQTACIDSVAAPVLCAGGSPCGVPITTSNTQLLIIGFGYLAGGVTLTPAAGWNGIVSNAAGNAIGNSQAVPGVYSPTWTNTAMPQMMAVAIKSPTSSLPPTTVPTLPVF